MITVCKECTYCKTHNTINTARHVTISGVYCICLMSLIDKETLFYNKNCHYIPLKYNSVKYICLNTRGQVKRKVTLRYTLHPKTKNGAITLFLWTSRNKRCYCCVCLKQFNVWSPQDVKFCLLHPCLRYIHGRAIKARLLNK